MIGQEPQALPVIADLLPIAHAARHARNLLTDACLRWDLDDLIGPAALIVTELVGNVVDHAHTFMTLEIAVRRPVLYLAVYDGSRLPPVPRHDRDNTSPGGLGLHLVAAFSAEWGYTCEGNGKTVWATLPLIHSND